MYVARAYSPQVGLGQRKVVLTFLCAFVFRFSCLVVVAVLSPSHGYLVTYYLWYHYSSNTGYVCYNLISIYLEPQVVVQNRQLIRTYLVGVVGAIHVGFSLAPTWPVLSYL